jgi:hypothetical protein
VKQSKGKGEAKEGGVIREFLNFHKRKWCCDTWPMHEYERVVADECQKPRLKGWARAFKILG